VGSNGFVTEVGPSGALLYSTYLGGEANDFIYGSALDSQGNIYVVGQASSKFFPTLNAFQPARAAAYDGFVAKLNTSLPHTSGLLYSTYLGGSSGNSLLFGAAADSQGHVYVVGGTNASNYPVTASALQPAFNGVPNSADPNPFGLLNDAVVTQLNPSAAGAAQLLYSTFLGGSGYNTAYSAAVDSQGKLVVAGATDSANFPVTQDGFDQNNAALPFQSKAFITRIDPTVPGPAGLLYSPYYGGGANDGPSITSGVAVAADPTGVSIVGTTSSTNMPVTAHGYQTAFGGAPESDAFVARFDITKTIPAIIDITNAASYVSAAPAAAPGEIVALFGTNIGPPTLADAQLDTAGKIATTVAGCQVLVNGVAAPIVYTSALQTSVILPYELQISQVEAAMAQVVCNGVAGGVFPLHIVSAAPAIFSSANGQAAVLNSDGSVNSPANPAARGSLVQIFGTGEGALSPAGEDGRIENGPVSGIPKPVLPVSVTFAGIASPDIEYAGVAAGSVDGLLQVNAKVPPSAPSGIVPIVLIVGGVQSQPGLIIAIK